MQQIEFPCATEGLKCSELFPEGQQKALQGSGGSGRHSWGLCCSPLGMPLVFPLGEAGLELLWAHLQQQHSKLQQSQITPTRGNSGGTQGQGEVSGATARAGCDHKTLCNMQKAA